jgi:hypothetical protein
MFVHQIALQLFNHFKTGGADLILEKDGLSVLHASFGTGSVRWSDDGCTVKVTFHRTAQLSLNGMGELEFTHTPPAREFSATIVDSPEASIYQQILAARDALLEKCEPYPTI